MPLLKYFPYLSRFSASSFTNKFDLAIAVATATVFTTSSGLLMMTTPSWAAVNTETSRDYRACAARLVRLGIPAESAASACAAALRPRDLGECVNRIQKQTQVPAQNILNNCLQARRPDDYAACVVGISKQAKDSFDPSVFTYCNRSLLPRRFARCVVGLRSEIDFSVVRAMDTCIDGSDRLGGALIPSEFQFQPTFETTPIPTQQPTPVNPTTPQRN